MTTSLDDSYRKSTALARRAARNFYLSFLPLPRAEFRAMCALYAFLRLTDDIGDADGRSTADRQEALAAWRAALERTVHSGSWKDAPGGFPGGRADRLPDAWVFPALLDVVWRYRLEPAWLHEVIDGVAFDVTGAPIRNREELELYCHRVAGTVGLCCLAIWGARSPRAELLAEECGRAFQLTNILRDLAEDYRRGRCYLPADELARFGCTPEQAACGPMNDALRRLLRWQADRARESYERSRELLRLVPGAGRRQLWAMLAVYGGLLDEMERRDFDVLTRRVRLPRWKKWCIAARCLSGVGIR